MIGKITLKSTGQELKVIKTKGGDPEFVSVLQGALEVVRSMDAISVALVIDCGDSFYTDFAGPYGSLSAGTSLINSKINNKWQENSE